MNTKEGRFIGNTWFLLAALFVMLAVAGIRAQASGQIIAGDYVYKEVYGGVALTEYQGPDTAHVVIPGKLNGKIVTEIQPGIFKNGASIKRLTVEEGVREIFGGAFESCVNLEEINLPSTVVDIEMHDLTGFDGCKSLKRITVEKENPQYYSQDGVLFSKKTKSLFYYPAGKRKKTYRVPEGVKAIGIFGENPYLEKIILPRSARILFHGCFMRPYNLKNVVASDGIKKLEGADHFGFTGKVKVTAYPNTFLWKYAKKEGIPYQNRSVKKPASVKGKRERQGIRISWDKNEDASGYVIYRSEEKNGKYRRVKQIKKASKSTWMDKDAQKGLTYFYKVCSYRTVANTKLYSQYSKLIVVKSLLK